MKRIYHPWHKWECYKAGFYNTRPPKNMSVENAKELYKNFLSDLIKFETALKMVIREWKYSCEHFLTNPVMNKIAWLGQASACISLGLPCKYRSGFYLLSKEEQIQANNKAFEYYEIWKEKYKHTSTNGKDKDIQLIFQM
jgi:hypothetical protein